MKHKAYLVKGLLALVLLAIGLGGGVAQGQGPAPQSSASVQAALGTAFTYQGRLTDGGVPADGTYDFKFRLWDADTGGSQVGSDILQDDVTVTDGLFTVQLDFGSSAFAGDARYLGIGVRPGDSPGQFTALTPRQELTPAPYALALPGLWTQQNAISPNLIGGYSGNSVASGVDGATISGGGTSSDANRVTDDYGTVGGGGGNQAGDDAGTTDDADYATVGGGEHNISSNRHATVGGGYNNTASGQNATIGGGSGNTVSGGTGLTIGGGVTNTASGDWAATVGGGRGNTASGYYPTVGGGYSNNAIANNATVGGGQGNIASGIGATVGGGNGNTASNYHSTIAGGSKAQASLYGQMAYASGQFDSAGDAQTSVYVLRNTTSDATPTELFLNGSSERLTIASNRTVTFDILVAARSSGGASAGYRIRGVIENTGDNTDFVGTPTVETLGEEVASWDVAVQADDTNDALWILVTGDATRTIRWVATVKTAEVGW